MTISFKSAKYSVECLKSAKFQNHNRIYLFKNRFPFVGQEYIVGVCNDDETLQFHFFGKLCNAFVCYIDYLVEYA